jgi:SAM-dependent methyltransferase
MHDLLERAGVDLVTWDLEATPYPLEDDSFDVVIMTEVFEHLRDYPVRSLEEARRVLRPGGRLYFTTPNAAYILNRLQLLRGRSVATPLQDWIGGLPHARHAREYTFDEVRHLMSAAGFTVRTTTSRHFHRSSGRTSPAARLLKHGLAVVASARPTLGPSIVVVAERPAQ